MEISPLSLIVPDAQVGPNLQAAINQAAGVSKAAVWIPASYAGTDTYTNPSSVPVYDMRGLGSTSFSSAISTNATLTGNGTPSSPLAVAGSALVSPVTTPNPLAFDTNLAFKGPNPYVDITRFGAVACNGNVIPSTTVTINSGSNSATFTSTTGFAIGTGVAIQGAGAVQSMTTPAAPTVTPSGGASLTGTGVTVASPTGSTTYSYKIVMCNIGYGGTAASAAATITTGLANLGARSTAITSIASGVSNTFTATVASTAELSAGMCVVIKGTTDDAEFGGVKIVASVVDGTHFTYLSGVDASKGISTTTATGGTIFYWLCNQLVLPTPTGAGQFYLIYGRTTGAYNLIGVTMPANLGYTDATYNVWEDYGSPMMDGMVAPWWVSATAPASATNDLLVTTISNIVGSTVTLVANAGTSVTSSTARLDNVPAILAASAVAFSSSGGGGMLYFPVVSEVPGAVQGFVTSSFLTLSGSVSQASRLFLGGTLKFSGNWTGSLTLNSLASGAGGFGIESHNQIFVQGAYPGIWRSGNGSWKGTTISASGNAYLAMFDTTGSAIIRDTAFSGGNSGDFMGVLYYRWTFPNSGFGTDFTNLVFDSGITQGDGQTLTPFVIFKNDTEINMRYFPMGLKGMWFSPSLNGMMADINMGEENQGAIMPLFSFYFTGGNVGGSVKIHNVTLDTSGYSIAASLPSNSGTFGFPLILENVNQGSGAPVVTGKPFSSVFINGMTQTTPSLVGQNIHTTIMGLGNAPFPGIRTSGIDLVQVTFATLGTVANGRMVYCADCTVANPCAGSGTGAIAKGLNSAWVCN